MNSIERQQCPWGDRIVRIKNSDCAAAGLRTQIARRPKNQKWLIAVLVGSSLGAINTTRAQEAAEAAAAGNSLTEIVVTARKRSYISISNDRTAATNAVGETVTDQFGPINRLREICIQLTKNF
jgi:hypothetical protein